MRTGWSRLIANSWSCKRRMHGTNKIRGCTTRTKSSLGIPSATRFRVTRVDVVMMHERLLTCHGPLASSQDMHSPFVMISPGGRNEMNNTITRRPQDERDHQNRRHHFHFLS